ncbi:MAG: hypothetical protein B5M54_02370 [Candidatus Aminicenantes bacterium 4484_214]|nr:MAG: hypothetical protein B5M54_02370 [Candidatus Aminicenantes bacterium 4484_214]HDJ23276.1 hypothetical protein [Candidatus Aminicenantes bacterium]
MFVYLSDEAREYFSSLATCSLNENPNGFLLGHKRGSSFIVERGVPGRKNLFDSPQEFSNLIQSFPRQLIGFYTLSPPSQWASKLFQPITAGLLLLQLEIKAIKKINYHPYLIDFEGHFSYKKLNIVSFQEGE